MNKRPALLSAIGFTFVLLAMLSISFTAQATPSENAPARPQALLLADDFNYGATPGNLTAVSAGNWISHSGTTGFVGYTTTSLSMTGYGSSGVGGAATVSTSGSEDVNRSFTNQTSGTVYFAALVNVSAAGTGDYFLHLKDAGTSNFRPRVFVKNDAGVLRFGLSMTATTGTYSTTAAFITNTTYLVVAKYNVDTGNSALYVLDTFSATEPPTPLVFVTGTSSSAVQGIAIRQGGSGARPAAIIDGIRVANTWADVVGAPPEADLSVAKSGPASGTAGEAITYTISLSNTGASDATATVLTDTFPAEVSFVTYTASLPVTFTHPSATELVWELGDVTANTTTLSIQLQGVISPSLVNGTLFTNTVTASTSYTETNLGNNTSMVSTLIGAPDLAVHKEGPTTANAGDTVTYTLTYSNDGSLLATSVNLVDQLPVGLAYVSDSGSAIIGANGVITWSLGSLTPGQSSSIVLTATALYAGNQVNRATISGLPFDSDLSNNTSIVTTTVNGADPFVIKTGSAVAFSGELITYTVVYGNRGSTAAAVTLTDTLPISFTPADIAHDGSLLNPIDGTNTRSWTATLAAGDRFTYTLALTVPTSIANNTRITNSIEIATSSLGSNPVDDLSSASSTVYQIVPISVARAGANGQVFAVEGRVTYVPGTYNADGWGVQDSSGGIAVFYTPHPTITLGDRVQLVATRGVNGAEKQLAAPANYFANLGSGPQVNPIPFATGAVVSGAADGWLTVISGTVSGLGACAGNYSFNVNDGSGATTVFVDLDTTINVCNMGIVNGDAVRVVGFGTLFGTLYEIKPRFPADVVALPNLSTSTKVNSVNGAVFPGNWVTYTIQLNNTGGLNATARVTDVLSSYYTTVKLLDFTQPTTGTLTWTGVVTAGQSVTLHFVAQVKSVQSLPRGSALLFNTAKVNDGYQASFTIEDPAPPIITIYGVYLPLIKR